jgi:nitrite reductase/ring-hydroxylating ferredoxin subunit
MSPSGHYYRAGEFCPHADAGLSTVDAHGNTIYCSKVNGYYRWHY